jgi:hypothetical protein
MWSYKGKRWDPPKEELKKWCGFVYEITDLDNGKKYIGKKSLWSKVTRPPLKGKKNKRRSIKESDWQTYHGSSDIVKTLVEEHGTNRFTREILRLCESLGEMSYYETKIQLTRDVLFKPDEYYNSFIGCRIHRNHITGKKKKAQKI